MITVLSREDSYERLLETEKQFAEETESVEEVVIRSLMLKKLDQALQSLTKEEADMIYELYYQESSETELSVKLGIPRTTLRSRKEKILKKLKKLL